MNGMMGGPPGGMSMGVPPGMPPMGMMGGSGGMGMGMGGPPSGGGPDLDSLLKHRSARDRLKTEK